MRNLLHDIAEFEILGVEVVILLGILTFATIVAAALVGWRMRGPAYKVRRKWHITLALIAIGLAVLHATLVILGHP